MIDDLIGRATMSGGYRELCSLRGDIDVPTAQGVISALQPLDTSWESTRTIIQRDMAYCERVFGWQCRLSNMIQRVTDGEPTKWKNFAPLATDRGTWGAVNRLLQVDCAIRVFEHEHGRLPESLQELTPSIFSASSFDPFTGGAFIYRPSADRRFTLYSLGHDRQDDGGKFTDFPIYNRDKGYDLDLETLKPR